MIAEKILVNTVKARLKAMLKVLLSRIYVQLTALSFQKYPSAPKLSLTFFFIASFFSGLAQAATYSLPAGIGSSPFNSCSFSSGTTYNCTGSINLGTNTTINITSSMTLNLTSGSLSAGDGLIINSNGNNFTISAPVGSMTIGNNFTGSVNLTAGGTINIGTNATITGNLTAGTLNLGSGTVITGTCTPSNTKCTPAPVLIAEYRFDECTQYTNSANQVVNNLNSSYFGTPKSGLLNAASGKINRLADFPVGSNYVDVVSGPVLTDWTITVWFKTPFNGSTSTHNSQYYTIASVNGGGDFAYLDRNSSSGAYRWGVYTTAGFTDGAFRFGTLANGWHHMTLVGLGSNTYLYIDGTFRDQVSRKTQGTFRYLGASYDYAGTSTGQGWGTPLDEFKIYNGPLTAAQITTIYNNENAGLNYDGTTRPTVCGPALHHVRLNHTGSGVTCTGSSVAINACSNADTAGTCTAETSGLTGNVVAGTVTVPFTIATGSSSTTVNIPVTTPQTVTLATSGLSVTPSNATTCWNGSSASCSLIYNDSGFIFDVPNHVSEVLQSVNVSAVKKSDNSLACIPAFASVSKNLTFKCSYSNPTTGSLPVRVNGNALNAANSTAAACDAGGRAVSLAFNASGVASTTFQYADVGNMSLTGTYTGSGADAGLNMTGSDTFIAAPKDLAFSGITAAPIKAGNNFSATVTARNNANNATPNFGKETAAEGATLAFVKYQPTGAGAVNGSFSGTLGAFSTGAATGSNLNWSEVGTIDLSATLTSGNYLGSGLTATGSTGISGAVGRFIPDHFDTVVTQGCATGSFTYSGQPFTTQITARNLSGNKTINYDGSINTTPNFSKTVTLSDANAVAGGSLAPISITSSSFLAGVANTTPAFTFTSAKTAPVAIKLRATDTDNVASSTTEGTANIRSGRLHLQNAYGSELLALPVPLEAQYWNGSSYIRNQQDSCTTIPASSIAMSNYRNNLGACETQLGYSSGGGVLVNGVSKTLRLTKPGAGNSGSVDLTANLTSASGSTCNSATVSSATAANIPWFGTNPVSRATFGIYKTPIIYLRENFNVP